MAESANRSAFSFTIKNNLVTQKIIVTAIGLFQKIILNTIAHMCIEQYDANATGE